VYDCDFAGDHVLVRASSEAGGPIQFVVTDGNCASLVALSTVHALTINVEVDDDSPPRAVAIWLDSGPDFGNDEGRVKRVRIDGRTGRCTTMIRRGGKDVTAFVDDPRAQQVLGTAIGDGVPVQDLVIDEHDVIRRVRINCLSMP
jgi:hypothetical protein